MSKPTPGRVIWVLCDPETNNDRDVLPATITGVNDDGTCNAIGHPDTPGQTSIDLRNVIVTASRSAAEKELESHVKDMPKVRDPETDRPKKWLPVDCIKWVKVAYWPPRDDQPASESSTSSPAKKTAAAKKTTPAKKTTTAKATAAPAA